MINVQCVISGVACESVRGTEVADPNSESLPLRAAPRNPVVVKDKTKTRIVYCILYRSSRRNYTQSYSPKCTIIRASFRYPEGAATPYASSSHHEGSTPRVPTPGFAKFHPSPQEKRNQSLAALGRVSG